MSEDFELYDLREAARVRDARAEPPINDDRVLVWWTDVVHQWTIARYMGGDWFGEDEDFYCEQSRRYPLWKPLPEAPEVKP